LTKPIAALGGWDLVAKTQKSFIHKQAQQQHQLINYYQWIDPKQGTYKYFQLAQLFPRFGAILRNKFQFGWLYASLFLFGIIGALGQKEDEGERMDQRLMSYQFKEQQINPDGNCMFGAIADQLFGDQLKHGEVRRTVVNWLSQNGNAPIDSSGTKLSDFLDLDQYPTWNHYCNKMGRNGVWGDHLALVGASEAYNSKIWILSSVPTPAGVEPVTIIEPAKSKPTKTIYLSHWHENHYNSLVKNRPS